MTEKNGTEPKVSRKPFKKGEKERHYEMFTKNSILARKHKALTKKYETAAETCLDDIEAGGYAEEPQGELDVGDGDSGSEARA